ncbi:MAG: TPM domain-containing protein, partial [Pseudomonadota bacterium]|nr:TPM domain-containing protein [Pseudomonadota bacterium]
MRLLSVAVSFFVAVAALLGAGVATAQDVVPIPPLNGRVVDTTGTLTALQTQALSAKLEAIETKNGSQVVILMVPTTAPEDIAAFSQRAGDRYKIGRRNVGDGLLVVVAKNDHRVDIAPAKSLEGAVPDLLAKRIINEQITPAFKAGDFAGGLNQAVDRLGQAIAGEGLVAPSPRSSGSQRHASRGFDFQDLAIFLFVGVPI